MSLLLQATETQTIPTVQFSLQEDICHPKRFIQTVSLVTEASSQFLLNIHSAAGSSSLKICYKVGKGGSPNQISTNDAQVVCSTIHTDRKNYFYPCLLTGSSNCHAVKVMKQK